MSVRITLRLRQNTSTEDDLGSPIAAGMGSVANETAISVHP